MGGWVDGGRGNIRWCSEWHEMQDWVTRLQVPVPYQTGLFSFRRVEPGGADGDGRTGDWLNGIAKWGIMQHCSRGGVRGC